MEKNKMSYLTLHYVKIMSKLQEITEKYKKYLRNVVTNVIIKMNKIICNFKLLVQLCSKGAGNYALYHVRKKY